ncbi:unnamed protein product [Pieris macdunnoughi]|nr:unnamed protein product [Pieris macdunnoughi]
MVSDSKISINETPVHNLPSISNISTHFMQQIAPKEVLLATAVIKAQAKNGQFYLLRALLDQGSQASFITESAVQLLGLRKTLNKSIISGLGGDKGVLASKYNVEVLVQSNHDHNFEMEAQAHVLRTITSLLPSTKIQKVDWPQLFSLNLADPHYSTPSKIDILLGADVYGDVIKVGLVRDPNGGLTAQFTALGWVLSGPTNLVNEEIAAQTQCHHNLILSMHTQTQIDDNELLKRFWQLDSDSDSDNTKILSEEETRCEEFYAKTTQRSETGRYVVRLPFKETDPQCKYGRSRDIAIKRLRLLEQRFKKNPELKARYSAVMQEYLDLGHMEHVTVKDKDPLECVYLPHHGVIREDKTTTKVRVVFDASCKGTNGISLNQTLMVGPKLQQDLRHIIMRWRMHPICLSADIVKMYRQVVVTDADADFQRLVWREDEESEIKDYRLIRVTFGTACAPYLAVKTLQQLAIDEHKECPDVAEKIITDYYVDDLLTGCETVEEGLRI